MLPQNLPNCSLMCAATELALLVTDEGDTKSWEAYYPPGEFRPAEIPGQPGWIASCFVA